MKYHPTVFSQSLIHIALIHQEKRNIRVHDKSTTVRMEPEFWDMFREIAQLEAMTLRDLCTIIYDRKHSDTSLSSAIRVFVAAYIRAALREVVPVEKPLDEDAMDMIG